MRDKTDIRDTLLGIDFIMKLRPVDYVWNYRDDYVDYDRDKEVKTWKTFEENKDDGDVINKLNREKHSKKMTEEMKEYTDSFVKETFENVNSNGSKKRRRHHHGFLAQDIMKINEESDNKFGGIQDHSIKSDKHSMTLGYDELLCPLVKAIQQIYDRFDGFGEKFAKIEKKLSSV